MKKKTTTLLPDLAGRNHLSFVELKKLSEANPLIAAIVKHRIERVTQVVFRFSRRGLLVTPRNKETS